MLNRNTLRQSLALALLSMSVAAVHAAEPVAPDAVVPVQGVVGGTDFPAASRAWRRDGDYVNVDNLRQMGRGLGKSQVRSLLGGPHFSEGLFGVSRWNYIFNFRTGPDQQLTCQYQVNFERSSGGYRVDTLHWDRPACQDALNVPAEAEPLVLDDAEAEVEAPTPHTLSADALFGFNRSGLEDILPQGHREVTALAASLEDAGQLHVSVVGHADRLGSAAYNQALSERRAETIRQLLVEEGVDASSITASGRGAAQPVSSCEDGLAREALIECLRPDRRVEIEVSVQH